MAERYNGWTNYETWLAKVWIDNEENDQRYWQREAEQAVANNRDEPCPDGAAIRELADDMKSSHQESMDENLNLPSGFFRDLLQGALDSVNWPEIAKTFIDEVEPETDE